MRDRWEGGGQELIKAVKNRNVKKPKEQNGQEE